MGNILMPQKGAQERFLASTADICIYGGAAGGGKSFSLLLNPLRYKNVDGFGAVIFRKNANQVFSEGGLWDESLKMYSGIKGAEMRKGMAQWAFHINGGGLSKISFSHIERDEDLSKFQGSQICCLCVEKDTDVLMGDGTYKKIPDVKVGDFVMTLGGKREVTKIGIPQEKECVLVEFPDGTKQIQSADHKFLTRAGWISYEDIIIFLDIYKSVLNAIEYYFSSDISEEKNSICSKKYMRHLMTRFRLLPCLKSYRELIRLQPKVSSELFDETCELSSTQNRSYHRFYELLKRNIREFLKRQQRTQTGRKQAPLLEESILDCRDLLESFSCMEEARSDIDSELFLEKFQELLRRISILLPQGTLSKHSLLPHCDISKKSIFYGLSCVLSDSKSRGFLENCLSCKGRYDERFHSEVGNGKALSLSLNDVVRHIPTCLRSDDEDKIHKGSRLSVLFSHPYTQKVFLSEIDCFLDSCKITPVGVKSVVCITVDDQNNYITHCGIVNRNCFDELTHFSKNQFFYMLSRNRSVCGVKPYVRASCNPDADSWVAEFISWWIDQDTGYPIKERSGKKRWMVRRGAEIIWGDTKDELIEKMGLKTEEERQEPKSVSFIASTIYDNQILLKTNPDYLANLKALSTVERERLLMGNWKIKPAAGLYFKRNQVGNMLDVIPSDVVKWVRCWDLAATVEKDGNNPDYTAGVLIGKRRNGRYVVADVKNVRMEANDVRNLIRLTAQEDIAKYKRVRIRLPQDPAQAGKDQAQSYIKFLSGFDVCAVRETGSKEARAEPCAAQWQGGNFDIYVAQWNDMFFDQLESFPQSAHKDMVDALSNGFNEIEKAFDIMSLIN